jgi:cell division protein FtsW
MPDKYLFYGVSALITIGVVASYSLSTYTTIFFSVNEFNFAIKQSLYAILAILIMWLLSKLDPDKWLDRIGVGLFISGLFLMIIMHFLPSSIVAEVGGAKRWIKILGISIAPVEFFKVGFIYFLAWSFNRKITHHKKHESIWLEIKQFLPYIFIFFIAVLLIAVLQNDLGQVVVIGVTLAVMINLAGGSLKLFISSMFAGLGVFIVIIFISEHRVERILTWWLEAQHWILEFFPDFIADRMRYESVNGAYQTSHSLNAINNGGLFGMGIGDGIYKLGFLSEVHTDFVLAGIAEEVGALAIFTIIMLFLFVLQRIFRIANRSEKTVYFLFNSGIGLVVAFAFLINSYGITAMVPIKGIAVPFLTYGGSGLIATSIAIGMVLMTSKKIDNKPKEPKPLSETGFQEEHNANYYGNDFNQNINNNVSNFENNQNNFVDINSLNIQLDKDKTEVINNKPTYP